jgi:three-Cys-motif partner protein
MQPVEFYQGREQTYVKHFFLERYLERVAYNIGSFTNDFVYVDGFSGPWRPTDQALNDTSFMIAIQQLRLIKKGLAVRGRTPNIRCLFVEKSPTAFAALQNAIQGVMDTQCHALNGEFENMLPEISRFIGRAFSLIFIDPTGWTGFGLKKMESVLRHRPGEVIVNFMFDYINRFLEGDRADLTKSFNELYGGPGWEAAVASDSRREEAIVEFYCERLAQIGRFQYVTFTRILKPILDQTYFYLIYATRNSKGLVEFRKVEEQAVAEQEKVRLDAKDAARLERTGQFGLFSAAEMGSGSTPFTDDRAIRLPQAEAKLRQFLDRQKRIEYDDALGLMLQVPLVFEHDVKAIVARLQTAGYLRIEGLKGKQRVPQYGQGQALARW